MKALGKRRDEVLARYAFILLDDFKARCWEATAVEGPLKNLSIRKLHSNLLQNSGKVAANFNQTSMREIFFQKFKSRKNQTLTRK